MSELSTRSRLETTIPQYEPVIVVGGGLSGLVLSKNLRAQGIEHVVLEAGKPQRPQAIHYLTSLATAEALGVTDIFTSEANQRTPITGYTRYDGNSHSLLPLEELTPKNQGRDGFVTLSMGQLRTALDDPTYVRPESNVSSLTRSRNGTWDVSTTSRDYYTAEVVIDATGTRNRMLRMADMVDDAVIDQRPIRACYGGVFPYYGPEDRLLFIDRFPPQEDIPARDTAGWIMPLGNNQAEVVVGWEGSFKNAQEWFKGKPAQLLRSYIDWFNKRGIEIDPQARHEVISGIFSQGLLDYRKLPRQATVVAFGESAGLNHPLNGYLIREIDDHAQVLATEIKRHLNGDSWQPYKASIARSGVKYGQERALGKRKTEYALEGEGRAAATHRLQEFLIQSLGEDGLWASIDNGVPMKQLLKGLFHHPQYTNEVLKLGWDYVKTLFSEDGIYLNELWLKHFSSHRKAR